MLPEWQNIQRILVMQLGSQQDLMLTIPALQRLRQLLLDAAIALMVSLEISQIGLQMPWIDDIFMYEGAGANVNPECELRLISQLRQRAFDAAVILTNPGESPYPLAYICYLAGIPIRVGQSQEFGGGVLSHWVKPQPSANKADQHLLLIESVFGNLLCNHYASSPGTSTAAISTT